MVTLDRGGGKGSRQVFRMEKRKHPYATLELNLSGKSGIVKQRKREENDKTREYRSR